MNALNLIVSAYIKKGRLKAFPFLLKGDWRSVMLWLQIHRLRLTQNLDGFLVIFRLDYTGCSFPRTCGGVKIVDVDAGIGDDL